MVYHIYSHTVTEDDSRFQTYSWSEKLHFSSNSTDAFFAIYEQRLLLLSILKLNDILQNQVDFINLIF